MSEVTEQSGSGPPSWRQLVRPALRVASIALVLVLLWGLVSAVDWAGVVDAIADLTIADWVRLALLTLGYYVMEALVLMAALPGLRFRQGLIAFLAPSAAAMVIPGPADLVTRFAMYSSWGFSKEETTASVMTSWVFSNMAKISLPVLGATAMAAVGRADADLDTIAIIAAAVLLGALLVLVLLLRSDSLARAAGRRAGEIAKRLAKPLGIATPDDLANSFADAVAGFRETAGDLLRTRSYYGFTAALGAQLLLFGILLTSLRGVGITAEELHWAEIFAAFALVQVLTLVPIMPGGFGIAEAAYVLLLVRQSDRRLADAVTAGALLFRLFSWFLIVPFGAAAWLVWKRTSLTLTSTRESSGDTSTPSEP